MSRVVLGIVGAVMVLMGIGAVVPGFELGTEPLWHAIAKIVIGLVAIVVAAVDKPKGAEVEMEEEVEEVEK